MRHHTTEFRSRAVRALVILHEREMHRFYATWRDAHRASIALPDTPDPNYASLETLLGHVLGAARGYVVWMTARLELPDPGIEPAPESAAIVEQAESYLEHLLERWPDALRDVPDDRLEDVTYPVWGVEYSIDAMLEHAVMHPMRHAFQLEELMEQQRGLA